MNTTFDESSMCTPWNTIPVPNQAAAENWIKSGVDILIAYYFVPVMIMVAGTGNLAFIFMVARLKRMHTITNFYLVNIAFADIILGVFAPSMFVYTFFSSPLNFDVPYPTDGVFCFIGYLCSYFGYLLSVGVMTLLSFERYLAVCKPLLHMSLQSKRRAIKMTGSVWIIAGIIGSLTALSKGKIRLFCLAWPEDEAYQNLPTRLHTCQPIIEIADLFTKIVEISTLVVAMAVNSVFYAFIIYALSTRSVAKSAQSEAQTQAIEIRNQVARTLVINGIVFFITQTPWRIMSLNVLFEEITGTAFLTKGQEDTVNVIGRTGLYLNSTANSFIYVFSSQFYRSGFIEAFSLFPKKKRGGNEKSTSKTTAVSNI